MSAEQALQACLEHLAECLRTNEGKLDPSSLPNCIKKLSPEHQSTLGRYRIVEPDSETLQNSTPAPTLQCVQWKPPTCSPHGSESVSESDSEPKCHRGRKYPEPVTILSLKSIEPPDCVKEFINQWSEDPHRLFNEAASGHDAADCYTLFAVYNRIRRNEEGIRISIIQQRFDCYFCYKTAVCYGLYIPETGWVNGGSKTFAEIVLSSSSQSCSVEEVKGKIVTYVDQGSGYNRWAAGLGGPGIFIVLPTEVAEGRKDFTSSTATFINFFRYHSRRYQEPVDELLAHFTELRIKQRAQDLGALSLGERIFKNLEAARGTRPWEGSAPIHTGIASYSQGTPFDFLTSTQKRRAPKEIVSQQRKRFHGRASSKESTSTGSHSSTPASSEESAPAGSHSSTPASSEESDPAGFDTWTRGATPLQDTELPDRNPSLHECYPQTTIAGNERWHPPSPTMSTMTPAFEEPIWGQEGHMLLDSPFTHLARLEMPAWDDYCSWV